jgi:hypothetical protein
VVQITLAVGHHLAPDNIQVSTVSGLPTMTDKVPQTSPTGLRTPPKQPAAKGDLTHSKEQAKATSTRKRTPGPVAGERREPPKVRSKAKTASAVVPPSTIVTPEPKSRVDNVSPKPTGVADEEDTCSLKTHSLKTQMRASTISVHTPRRF